MLELPQPPRTSRAMLFKILPWAALLPVVVERLFVGDLHAVGQGLLATRVASDWGIENKDFFELIGIY